LPAGQSPVLATLRRELSLAGASIVKADSVSEPSHSASVCLTINQDLGPGSYRWWRDATALQLQAGDPAGLLYGFFASWRWPSQRWIDPELDESVHPAMTLRMLDHWDNIDIHPVMGQVERGYSGGSIFYDNGRLRWQLDRLDQYARLLASIGINAISINNVNVHRTEASLLTSRRDWVARLADHCRPWGIKVFLSVSFAAPMTLGGLPTCDPVDAAVVRWWDQQVDDLYMAVPDLGGFVVKADSEGQPGPFAYGRSHADGANLLAGALAPHHGEVHWRCFVYNHTQDWRDRSTDRAKAAYDHFVSLDGQFAPNAVLQIKNGPIDFQVREPVSPLLAAMPHTRINLELQLTQEYTGQQQHVFFLPSRWCDVLNFRPFGNDQAQWQMVANGSQGPGGLVAVSSVGMDPFWCGHPLAQANIYSFGRLSVDPTLSPADLADEWLNLTFGNADQRVKGVIADILLRSADVYESYTAPLGVGFMVTPGSHYGPCVDGYEYSPWGTYHFADRHGIGVDRTVASGSAFSAQYSSPWKEIYEDPQRCPESLLLFFHHVAWSAHLADGRSLAQTIYDNHADGAAQAQGFLDQWQSLAGLIDPTLYSRGLDRFKEQAQSARQWRDQIMTYVWRHSGIADCAGRVFA
jgi:alpha-glucuronidase